MAATTVALSDLPLEERLRQKKNGFAVFQGDRESEQHQHDDVHNDSQRSDKRHHDKSKREAEQQVLRRANKNQPLELTSKRAVGRYRQVVDVKSKKVVDPRFESMSGRLNEDLYEKSYAFLDEYKERELEELRRQLKIAKSKTRKEELKHEINLRTQERSEKQKRNKIKTAITKRKHDEREAVASGKNPFYLKRKDKKKLELQAKFQDLQETGKLSKFMAKKRKKNASKDHRWLPTARKA